MKIEDTYLYLLLGSFKRKLYLMIILPSGALKRNVSQMLSACLEKKAKEKLIVLAYLISVWLIFRAIES